MKVSAVIVASGRGRRMGADKNKVFLSLSGKEIIAHTIAAFEVCGDIDEIVVVTGEGDISLVKSIAAREGFKKLTAIVQGGKERQNSVYNGLMAATGDYAAIHDGARCLITPKEISAAINDAVNFGAAAVGVTVKDTLKSIDKNGNITGTIDREKTVLVQTPQVFKLNEIKRLHKRAAEDNITVTDDCAILEHYGKSVHITIGSYDNIKITTPEDMETGAQILRRRK